MAEPVEVIAHRGYSERAPENTLAALRLAIDAGAHALEFDLHATADGVPVLYHDFTLARTSGVEGRVDQLELAALQRLDAGRWFDDAFDGERIPTLADALELASPARSPAGPLGTIYPEIKGWRDESDIAAIVDALRDAAWLDAATIISLDWDALAVVRALEPAVRIGFVYDDARLHGEALSLAEADGNAIVDPDMQLLLADARMAAAAHQRGVDIACWTVNRPADAQRLVAMGVRRLTTNRVEAILHAVR